MLGSAHHWLLRQLLEYKNWKIFLEVLESRNCRCRCILSVVAERELSACSSRYSCFWNPWAHGQRFRCWNFSHLRLALFSFLAVIKGKMSLSMGEMSILYLVPQTGRGTFMPSDLILANRSLWFLPGAGLNDFSHCTHREQDIVIMSCVKPLGSPRAGVIVILKCKYLLTGFIYCVHSWLHFVLTYTDPCEVRFLGNFDFSRNTRTNQRLFTFKGVFNGG